MGFDLYREIILDHYKNPRNKGELKGAHAQWRESNPLCGDEVQMQLNFDSSGKISEIKFSGDGCAISLASASMLTEMAKGKAFEEIQKMGKDALLKELGINPGPTRIKCALLPLKVLKMAVYSHFGKEADKETSEI